MHPATRLAVTAAAVLIPVSVAAGSGAPPLLLSSSVPTEVAAVATVADGTGTPSAGLDAAWDTVVPTAKVGAGQPRPALADDAGADDTEIPLAALSAYQRAAVVIGQVDPACHLDWQLLAAIGRIESDHGRFGGATLDSAGRTSPRIRGPVLDGRGPFAKVRDTDAGRIDGSTRWDRAVGPMQFLPSTWSVVAVDADSDGVRSPDDLDDAALGAAVFLCSGSESMSTRAGAKAAVLRYNPSTAYVHDVLALATAYEAGRYEAPVDVSGQIRTARLQAPVSGPVEHAQGHGKGDAQGHGHAGAAHGSGGAQVEAGGPVGGETDEPSKPDHPVGPIDPVDPTDPTDPVDPTEPTDPGEPETPPTTTLDGVLAPCAADETTWCLDDVVLDVGSAELLDSVALADLDVDGTVETHREELTGLVGTTVTLEVEARSDDAEGPATVVSVNGLAYR